MRTQEGGHPVWWIYAPKADGTVAVSKAHRVGNSYGEHNPAVVTREEAVEMWEYGARGGGVRETNLAVCMDLYAAPPERKPNGQ